MTYILICTRQVSKLREMWWFEAKRGNVATLVKYKTCHSCRWCYCRAKQLLLISDGQLFMVVADMRQHIFDTVRSLSADRTCMVTFLTDSTYYLVYLLMQEVVSEDRLPVMDRYCQSPWQRHISALFSVTERGGNRMKPSRGPRPAPMQLADIHHR